jgi:hypothetical protein
MTFRDIRVAVNETGAPSGANWAQNTDGFGASPPPYLLT